MAIQHLEMTLVNVGCDDPGATIGTTLLLPMLQVRPDLDLDHQHCLDCCLACFLAPYMTNKHGGRCT